MRGNITSALSGKDRERRWTLLVHRRGFVAGIGFVSVAPVLFALVCPLVTSSAASIRQMPTTGPILALSGKPFAVAVDTHTSRLIAIAAGGTVLKSAALAAAFSRQSGAQLAASPNGSRLAAITTACVVQTINVVNFKVSRPIVFPRPGSDYCAVVLGALAGYELSLGGSANATVTPFNPGNGKWSPPIVIPNDAEISDFAITPDGKTAYVATDGGLYELNLRTSKVERRLLEDESLLHLVISADGKWVYASSADGVFAVATDVEGTSPLIRTSHSTPPGDGWLTLSPTRHELYESTDNAVVVISTTTRRVLARIAAPLNGADSNMVTSKDGAVLYACSGNNQTDACFPIDVSSRIVGQGYLANTDVDAVALSPNGKSLWAWASYSSLGSGALVISISPSTGAVGHSVPV